MNNRHILILMIFFSQFTVGQRLNMSLSDNRLDMDVNDSIIYKFYLTEPSKTTVKFTNLFGGQEIVFEKGASRNKGWHTLNVKADSIRKLVPDASSGVYYITIITAVEGGKAAQYNSFDNPWGEPVVVENLHYDSITGNIYYSLPVTSMVKLRVGFPDGSLVRTITDAEPQNKGDHTVKWDGYDQAKSIRADGFAGLQAKVIAYALPKTAFILANPASPVDYNASPSYPENFGKYALHPFAKLPWKDCSDLLVDFKVTSNADSTFSFDFGQQDEKFNRFFTTDNEIYISIDGIYVVENPNVAVPGKYTIAFPGVPEGKHTVIVNLILLENRISIGLKEVIVL